MATPENDMSDAHTFAEVVESSLPSAIAKENGDTQLEALRAGNQTPVTEGDPGPSTKRSREATASAESGAGQEVRTRRKLAHVSYEQNVSAPQSPTDDSGGV